MRQKEIISRRLNNLEFLKESHEIVKYAPQYYDENGAYQKDEWTCFSDIGKEYEGGLSQIFTGNGRYKTHCNGGTTFSSRSISTFDLYPSPKPVLMLPDPISLRLPLFN